MKGDKDYTDVLKGTSICNLENKMPGGVHTGWVDVSI